MDKASALQGTPQRQLIGVFQVAADRKARCDSRDDQTGDVQQPLKVERGRLSFEIGIGAQDDFLSPFVSYPHQQLLDAKPLGADALQVVDRSTEHVVATLELTGALDGDDVTGLLHHTQHVGVATLVEADPAQLPLAQVEAAGAEATRSLAATIASARRRVSSGSDFNRWKAMRCADFGPIPGRRPRASMRSWTAEA